MYIVHVLCKIYLTTRTIERIFGTWKRHQDKDQGFLLPNRRPGEGAYDPKIPRTLLQIYKIDDHRCTLEKALGN